LPGRTPEGASESLRQKKRAKNKTNTRQLTPQTHKIVKNPGFKKNNTTLLWPIEPIGDRHRTKWQEETTFWEVRKRQRKPERGNVSNRTWRTKVHFASPGPNGAEGKIGPYEERKR